MIPRTISALNFSSERRRHDVLTANNEQQRFYFTLFSKYLRRQTLARRFNSTGINVYRGCAVIYTCRRAHLGRKVSVATRLGTAARGHQRRPRLAD